MTRFDVWVPDESRGQVLSALESLDALDEALLQLPVTVNGLGSGPLLTGEQRPGGPAVIGFSTGYDVFDQPGWTPEKFAEFVTSRSHLHVLIGCARAPPWRRLPAICSPRCWWTKLPTEPGSSPSSPPTATSPSSDSMAGRTTPPTSGKPSSPKDSMRHWSFPDGSWRSPARALQCPECRSPPADGPGGLAVR